jgi:hypothetical protein
MRSYFSSIQLVAPRTIGWTGAWCADYGFAMAPPICIRSSRVDQGAALVHRPQHAWRTAGSPSITPGSDLKRAFVASMLKWIDAGWQLGEFSSTGGTFFCTRGAERRMVCITPSDPGEVKNCY